MRPFEELAAAIRDGRSVRLPGGEAVTDLARLRAACEAAGGETPPAPADPIVDALLSEKATLQANLQRLAAELDALKAERDAAGEAAKAAKAAK